MLRPFLTLALLSLAAFTFSSCATHKEKTCTSCCADDHKPRPVGSSGGATKTSTAGSTANAQFPARRR